LFSEISYTLPILQKHFLIKKESFFNIKIKGLNLLELNNNIDRDFVFNLIEQILNEPLVSSYSDLYSINLSEFQLEDFILSSELSDFLKKLGEKILIYLSPKTHATLTFSEQETATLELEKLINKKTRHQIGESLIKKFIETTHDLKNLLAIISPKTHQFHPEIIGSKFFTIYENFKTTASQEVLYTNIINHMCIEFSWDNRLFEKHVKIFESQKVSLERKEKTISLMIWIATKLFLFHHTELSNKNLELVRLSQDFFAELLARSDENERSDESSIFFETLQSNAIVLNKFLAQSKPRRYAIAVILSAIFQDEDATYFLDFFGSHNCYKEGIYQRIAIKALKMLLWHPRLSRDEKRFLFQNCYHLLESEKDKNIHFSSWGITISILMSSSDTINHYLNQCQNANIPFSLTDLYWKIFQDTFELKNTDYIQYVNNFNPTKNLHHYSLFAFRQGFSFFAEEDSMHAVNITFLDHLIKTFLFEGVIGYRRLRYETDANLHLAEVFNRKNGLSLKIAWQDCDYRVSISSGKFQGSAVYLTDDIWDFLTWGDGINCLDPIGGDTKLLSHILDGRNQLVLLRDRNDKVIAGYILHLLLREKSEPILAIGATYISGNIVDEEAVREIQALLDSIVLHKAKTMAIPLVALPLKSHAVAIERQVINAPNNSLPLLIKQGFIQDGKHLYGVDATMVEYKEEYEKIERLDRLLPRFEISNYQYISLPPEIQLSDSPAPILKFSSYQQAPENLLNKLKKASLRLKEKSKIFPYFFKE